MTSKRKSTSQRGLDESLIVEGKRTRKPVKRFEFETTATEASSDVGNVTLGSFEKIKQNIMFISATELKPLHKILFGTVGRPATLKQEIENFKGFPYPAGSANYKRLKSALEKLPENNLLTMKSALDLEGRCEKDHMVAAIVKFLTTLKKPVTPKKRLSDENEAGSSAAKKPRSHNNSPELRAFGLQLSESSSDEDELEEEVVPAKAAKPKKRVSFEDEHRLVQFGETDHGDVPRLVETPDNMESGDDGDDEVLDDSDVGKLSEFGLQVVEQFIRGAADTPQITVGWVIKEIIKLHPEFVNNKEAIREHAIRVIRSMDPSSNLNGADD